MPRRRHWRPCRLDFGEGRPRTTSIDLIRDAVAAAVEVRPAQRIVGERPRLATGFVDRAEMAALRSALEGEGVATLCSLRGMRGVGKSQLPSAFAQECEHAGWSVVAWVDAGTRDLAVAQLAALARQVGFAVGDEEPGPQRRPPSRGCPERARSHG
jgi:hypothetical protein